MALNPACTPGTAERTPAGVVGRCGCGWEQAGFDSRRQALKAQKEHRFPGPNPREQEEPQRPLRRAPRSQLGG